MSRRRTASGLPSMISALMCDTGGTLLDWYTGIAGAFGRVGLEEGVVADWPLLTRTWRRLSTGWVNDGLPMQNGRAALDMDGVLHQTLLRTLAEHSVQGFSGQAKASLVRAWRSIPAWPDVALALPRLRSRFIVAPFTILRTSLIIEASRRNGLSWDCIISCEMIGIYKTDPLAYEAAARWLDLPHDRILMVTTHNNDLVAAHENGFPTAFVKRPMEWGGERPPSPDPDPRADLVADDLGDLANQLGCPSAVA
jgi:2-haloacid dehalogenase